MRTEVSSFADGKRIPLLHCQIRNYFLAGERAVETTRSKPRALRSAQPPPAEKPSTACVLSCVVGSGPPARTTSHRYLLISVSLGGKSISFRRYCAAPVCTGSETLTASISRASRGTIGEKEYRDSWERAGERSGERQRGKRQSELYDDYSDGRFLFFSEARYEQFGF